MNLLDSMLLAGLRPMRKHVERLEARAPGQELRAQVEFRMTPEQLDPGEGRFELSVCMSCRVTAEVAGARVELLKAEYLAIASYRPRPGFELTADWFRSRHSDLGRQLYPLVQQRMAPWFAEFGFGELRLPVEVIAEKRETPAGPKH